VDVIVRGREPGTVVIVRGRGPGTVVILRGCEPGTVVILRGRACAGASGGGVLYCPLVRRSSTTTLPG